MTYDPYYSVFGNPIRHGNYAYELDFFWKRSDNQMGLMVHLAT